MSLEKTISLLHGYIEGWAWQIYISVQRNGAFHGKGKINTHRNYDDKQRVRRADNRWFKDNLGALFMNGKEVHHEWGNEAKCCIVSKKEHKLIHGGALSLAF